jgi:hypothetical protein
MGSCFFFYNFFILSYKLWIGHGVFFFSFLFTKLYTGIYSKDKAVVHTSANSVKCQVYSSAYLL